MMDFEQMESTQNQYAIASTYVVVMLRDIVQDV
jgi:hypothetical protein